MPQSHSQDHTPPATSALTEDLAQLAARMGTEVLQLNTLSDTETVRLVAAHCLKHHRLTLSDASLHSVNLALDPLRVDPNVQAIPLDGTHTLVISAVETYLYKLRVVAVIDAPASVATALVRAACEATMLDRKAKSLQLQLDISAQQIAQSFEEQCWLRDLARNMSISPETANANLLAQGILRPMVDLLRSEELFLLVREDETTRSGLTSSYFGTEKISIAEVAQLMQTLVQTKPTGALVLNKTSLLAGRVHSLVAVPILSCERPLGYIVAINRLPPSANTFHLMAPEFGRVEVGLLEEASVLLSTQTHNIRLILDSQHLALGTLQAMSRAIDARDPYTRGHSERVARLSFELAEILGLEETACQEIYVAGILHDVGKIGVPDRVLLKAGALSDEEFDIIKQHPEIGYRIVEQLGKLHFTLPGVLYHHERWDGRGYPQGLAGDDIPLMARIIAVADSFDAMTSSRPYRNAMPLAQACEIIQEGSGKQWDAMIVRCFQHWRQQRMTSLPQLPRQRCQPHPPRTTLRRHHPKYPGAADVIWSAEAQLPLSFGVSLECHYFLSSNFLSDHIRS